MRIRSIKPEILDDEKTGAMGDAAWRLFVSLIVLADDHGNVSGDARWLHRRLFWAREDRDVAFTEALIGELHDLRVVRLYEVRGATFLHIVNWSKHQRIDNAAKPKVPPPSDPEALVREFSPRDSANRGGSPLDRRGEERKGEEVFVGLPPDGVPLFPGSTDPPGESLRVRAKVEATAWVGWFNQKFEREFAVRDVLVEDVRKLLRKGYSQEDMRMVALHRRFLWGEDDKMAKHLVPSTLLRLKNFETYIDPAREYFAEKPRPNGNQRAEHGPAARHA